MVGNDFHSSEPDKKLSQTTRRVIKTFLSLFSICYEAGNAKSQALKQSEALAGAVSGR